VSIFPDRFFLRDDLPFAAAAVSLLGVAGPVAFASRHRNDADGLPNALK